MLGQANTWAGYRGCQGSDPGGAAFGAGESGNATGFADGSRAAGAGGWESGRCIVGKAEARDGSWEIVVADLTIDIQMPVGPANKIQSDIFVDVSFDASGIFTNFSNRLDLSKVGCESIKLLITIELYSFIKPTKEQTVQWIWSWNVKVSDRVWHIKNPAASRRGMDSQNLHRITLTPRGVGNLPVTGLKNWCIDKPNRLRLGY